MTAETPLPQKFGRYVLREAIASGGMAEVFRATLPGFGGFEKQVAIKRMYRQFSEDGTFVEMLTDEAKIVSQLNHPNIAQIIDFSQVDDDYYIALEYVAGVDLFRLLQRQFERGENLPVALTVHIVGELCSALDYAHARQTRAGDHLAIVHRDVSPQNVLVGFQGEVKLTDFGIAKAAYRYTQTQSGTVKGKLYYMSPEQARGEAIDHRSDLFAVGILLFELLCTRPMYTESDSDELLVKVRSGELQWPEARRSELPQPLLEVVDRALSADPSARFQTGRELRTHLLAAARSVGLLADRESLGAYLRDLYQVSDKRPPTLQLAHDPTTPHWSDSQPNGTAVSTEQVEQELKALEAEADGTAPPPTELVPPVREEPDLATSMLDLAEIAAMLGTEPPETALAITRPSPEELLGLEEGDPTDLGHVQPTLDGPKQPTTGSRKVRIPSTVMPHVEPSVGVAASTEVPAKSSTMVDSNPPTEPLEPPTGEELNATQIHFLEEGTTRRPPKKSTSSPARRARAPSGAQRVAPPPSDPPASWQLIAVTAAVWAGVVTLSMYSLLLLIR